MDPQGRILLCAHGDREVIRLEANGMRAVIATGYGDQLYVTSYGSQAIMRYDLAADSSLSHGRIFIDMAGQKGAPNGMAVDSEGNVYSGGPGGLWIMDKTGRHIGSIALPAIAAGLAFGGPDMKTLYILDLRNLLQWLVKVPGTPLASRATGTPGNR